MRGSKAAATAYDKDVILGPAILKVSRSKVLIRFYGRRGGGAGW